jgi:hypothetical protein
VLWNRSRSLSKSFERGWLAHDRLEVFFGNRGDKRSQLINTQPKIAIKRQSVLAGGVRAAPTAFAVPVAPTLHVRYASPRLQSARAGAVDILNIVLP